MYRLFAFASLLLVVPVKYASAESLYVTTSARIEDPGYIFIAPYVTGAQTSLSVSITKASTSSGSANSDSKGATPAPAILHAQVKQAPDGKWRVTYSVSCDLRTVLHPTDGDAVKISGANPDTLNGTHQVISVAQDTIVVDAGTANPGSYSGGATISGTSCLASAETSSFSVAISVTAVPTSHAFLYLTKNAFFSDTINVSVDNNGMLSNSDSSSTQQITAILTELAQTVAAASPLGRFGAAAPAPASPRQRCFSSIANLIKPGPYYDSRPLNARQMGSVFS
jgi:hypothetical protein